LRGGQSTQQALQELFGEVPGNATIYMKDDPATGIPDIAVETSSVDPGRQIGSARARGMGVCYGFDKGMLDQLAANRLLQGDETASPAVKALPFPRLKGAPPYDPRYPEAGYLMEMAKGAHIAVMARLPFRPRGVGIFYTPPYNGTIGDFLNDILQGFPHKWRGKVLLVTPPFWLNAEPVVPWEMVKGVRATAAEYATGETAKPWPFARVCAIAAEGSKLSLGHWERLGDEFPILENVVRWYPLLARAAKSPAFLEELSSKRGVAASRLQNLSPEPFWQNQLLTAMGGEPIARVRIRPQTVPGWGPGMLIAFLNDEGQMWMGQTIRLTNRSLTLGPPATPHP